MREVDNLLRILSETKIALQNRNTPKLKELSNQTVHTASIEQDADNILIAVIVYSLSKIVENKEEEKAKEIYEVIKDILDDSILALKNNNERKFKDSLKVIRITINEIAGDMKKYIQDVFHKASINKASKIYEHGISMEKTAKLLGITMFDLAGYFGQKNFEEKGEQTINVRTRIKLIENMFK